MKVEAIRGYSYQRYNTSNQAKNERTMAIPPDLTKIVKASNYGRDIVNRPNIPTFTGANLTKAAIELALQLPVSDRLAQVIQNIKLGDVVLLSKDFTKAQASLRKYAAKLSFPIKREIYLADNNLKHNYAFFKHPNGDNHILNINDNPFYIRVKGTHYSLDAGKSSVIQDGNVIQFLNSAKDSGEHFVIKSKPKTDLSDFEKIFSKTYDYTKETETRLNKMNFETLSKEIMQSKGVSAKIDFSKIGGQAKAVEELKKGILYPVKYPSAYTADDITRGYILYGPAGTGKTEISRALANEANINYMYMSGTEFENKYVGESEANVRAFFQALKENQPSIGVIDEIDAIGKERGDKDVYGAKVVNQILTSMTDLYNSGDDVFVLGLTNKYDTLDSALKRSERFSKHIKFDIPDKDGISQILDIHTANKPLDKNFKKSEIVDKMFEAKAVGGDIKYMTKLARENMMKRLGIYEKMENGTYQPSDMNDAKITQQDFLDAVAQFKEQRGKNTKPIGFNK